MTSAAPTPAPSDDPAYDLREREGSWGTPYEEAMLARKRATICPECGSGILDGEHIADYPCSTREAVS